MARGGQSKNNLEVLWDSSIQWYCINRVHKGCKSLKFVGSGIHFDSTGGHILCKTLQLRK